MRKKVLVLATSINTKGGISSVIKAYQHSKIWNDWNCYWIATHIDKSQIAKITTYIQSIFKFLLNINSYSIVHIHFSEPATAMRKLLFVKLSKLFEKKIIIHFHSFSIDSTINGKYENLYKKIFFASDKIIVLSEQWEKWLIEKWPTLKSKIEVVYNPCQTIDPKNLEFKKSKVIIYAGALNARKGYIDLINAFSKIANKYPDWQLHLAGNGELEKAESLITELNLKNQIVLKGWISGEDKEKFFKTASIFCLPSYAEGFPMAVLDAWSYGIPVITTPVGGLPDILIDKKNALIFNPSDTETLSKILDELIGDEKLQADLGIASLDMSRGQFNLENITTKVDHIYQNLMEPI